METFTPLLTLYAGPVTRSFDVFFNLRPHKRLSKQSGDLRRYRAHYDVTVMLLSRNPWCSPGWYGASWSRDSKCKLWNDYNKTKHIKIMHSWIHYVYEIWASEVDTKVPQYYKNSHFIH